MDGGIDELIELTKDNEVILQSILKTKSILERYQNPCCSISGGKDSDIMLDIIYKLDTKRKCSYVWFNTGIEYQATKDHIDWLEEKYDIQIFRERAIKPIPLSCKQYGQPFLSKLASSHIDLLQRNNFQWEDDTFENLCSKYPNCRSAISWWTNHNNGEKFNISYNNYLKEFLMDYPPDFQISDKCCTYAKKEVSHQFESTHNVDLRITGIRRAEGGVRALAYTDCFTDNSGTGLMSAYRPLFWYTEKDEADYDRIFEIKHSDCYEVYGFSRTGCVGCPFNKDFEEDAAITAKYEPALAKAAGNIFKDSYEYTRKHNAYVAIRRERFSKVKAKAKEDFDRWYWRQGGYEQHHWNNKELKKQRNDFIEQRLKEHHDEIYKRDRI